MDTFKLALTFDDVLLKPRYAGFLRSEINLGCQLTKRLKLTTPLISAPMDTVTENGLAIALAREGGLGIIHRNLTIAQQVAEVKKVKALGLPVGAAVGSSPGFEARVDLLVEAGVDLITVDSAHGHTLKVITTVAYIKSHYDVDVMAGNVATTEGAKALISAGADALRVGMGPGAICTTRIVSGMGVPQLTAILDTAKVASRHNVPVIADGGINFSGDVVKALAAGASAVMLGRLFGATSEAPGKVLKLKPADVPSRFKSIINGADEYTFKEYRGMGSVAAMQRGIEVSSEDEFHGKNFKSDVLIAEGVEGLIPCSGSVKELIAQITGGVTSGMFYVGSKSITDLWENAEFMRISQSSLHESHPHDLFITNPGANYN
ncbi:MAG TPA: IMP dehydrogenase [Candidatus Saccharimonadales bacterium]|jgi:IMP dehydrogenase|nr:IMP dehydrogenase [Candidatus Saccharimonadales bacterium]